eukprot:333140_1
MVTLHYTIIITLICHINPTLFAGEISQYLLEDTLSKYKSIDYSKPTPLLKVSQNARIMDLLNAEHFDNILRDTLDNMRPPSIIIFWNSSNPQCTSKYNTIDFNNSVINNLPSRSHLFAATYDYGAAQYRIWYRFTPERDLKQRFNINNCPSIVFIPSTCNGLTNWCIDKNINEIIYLGCNEYSNQCTDYEILNTDNWINIVKNKLKQTENIPILNSSFRVMRQQQQYLVSRDKFSLISELRNNFVVPALPAFSETGYKIIKTPVSMQNELFQFYKTYKTDNTMVERWNYDDTKLNTHRLSSFIIDLNLNVSFKEYIANNYIKPIMEEWLGFELQLTSFYGLREYHSGHILKNHIDRIDIMIFAASISIAHIISNDINLNDYNTWLTDMQWPFEGIDFEGNNIRYNHEPGTMIIFESAKFIHGRPYMLPYINGNNNDYLIHVGAFCYFQPANPKHYKLQMRHARNARNNINRFITGNINNLEPLYYPPPNKVNKKEL